MQAAPTASVSSEKGTTFLEPEVPEVCSCREGQHQCSCMRSSMLI